MHSITQATVEDAETIWQIQQEAFEGQAEIYKTRQLPALLQTLEELVEEFAHKTFLKAVINGEIVGSVRFANDEGVYHIGKLVVLPKYQNLGIGSCLMEEAEKYIPANTTIELFTGMSSNKNIHIYQRLGYKQHHRSITPEGIPLVYMQKRT